MGFSLPFPKICGNGRLFSKQLWDKPLASH